MSGSHLTGRIAHPQGGTPQRSCREQSHTLLRVGARPRDSRQRERRGTLAGVRQSNWRNSEH